MHSLSLPQLALALALAAGAGVKVEDDFAGATHDGLAPAKATPTVKASSVLCEGKGAKQQCFPPPRCWTKTRPPRGAKARPATAWARR